MKYVIKSIMGCEPCQGGAKIKEIRESSGANIKAYQSCAPQVSPRNVLVWEKSIEVKLFHVFCAEHRQSDSTEGSKRESGACSQNVS